MIMITMKMNRSNRSSPKFIIADICTHGMN